MAVHDLPDYTREMIIKYTGGFIGLEELAYRLKSIVPWDLQGNVIFMEDFESEVTEWDLVPDGTGSSAARSSVRKWSGDWSIKLVAGDEVDASSYIERNYNGNEAVRLGFFSRLLLLSGTGAIILRGSFQVGAFDNHFALRFRPADQVLEYFDENGIWQTITLDWLGRVDGGWWPLLLVVDLTTGYYVKAFFGGTEFDLSAYKVEQEDATGFSFAGSLVVEVDAVGAEGGTIHVDDIVVVKNVP